jgi:hypothetical protein
MIAASKGHVRLATWKQEGESVTRTPSIIPLTWVTDDHSDRSLTLLTIYREDMTKGLDLQGARDRQWIQVHKEREATSFVLIANYFP